MYLSVLQLVVYNSFTPVKMKHEVIIGTIPTNEGGYQSPAPPTMPGNPIGFQSLASADYTSSPSDIGLSVQPSAPMGRKFTTVLME